MDWKKISILSWKRKGPITQMYATMIALLILVSLTDSSIKGNR